METWQADRSEDLRTSDSLIPAQMPRGSLVLSPSVSTPLFPARISAAGP